MCKPDAVERGLIGEIVGRLERKGLKMVAGQLRAIDEDLARQHYAEHVDKGFFPELLAFVTRSPAFTMVWEGPDDCFDVVRRVMGETNPIKAAPGTIRGDLGTLFTENLVHGSDSNESAAREIALVFPGLS